MRQAKETGYTYPSVLQELFANVAVSSAAMEVSDEDKKKAENYKQQGKHVSNKEGLH